MTVFDHTDSDDYRLTVEDIGSGLVVVVIPPGVDDQDGHAVHLEGEAVRLAAALLESESKDSLQQIAGIAKAITEWLAWAEENYGEEFAFISEDLIGDLAAYIKNENIEGRCSLMGASEFVQYQNPDTGRQFFNDSNNYREGER